MEEIFDPIRGGNETESLVGEAFDRPCRSGHERVLLDAGLRGAAARYSYAVSHFRSAKSACDDEIVKGKPGAVPAAAAA
jgi:hypothetical protein